MPDANWSNLIAAAAFFVLLHLIVSGTRMRDALVGRIGQNAYMGLFSLASVAGLAWLGMAFADARTAEWNAAYWSAAPAAKGRMVCFSTSRWAMIVRVTFEPAAVRAVAQKAIERGQKRKQRQALENVTHRGDFRTRHADRV